MGMHSCQAQPIRPQLVLVCQGCNSLPLGGKKPSNGRLFFYSLAYFLRRRRSNDTAHLVAKLFSLF